MTATNLRAGFGGLRQDAGATGAAALIIPYTAARGYPPSAASPLLAAVPIGMLIVGRFCRAAVREWLAFPLALLVGAATRADEPALARAEQEQR